jgi:nitroreductase
METLEAIYRRRSVRSFLQEMPDEDMIEKVLGAARWAPSGLNNQPWRFMVVRDSETRQGLARFTKYSGIVLGAPLSIIVCLDLSASYHREKDIMAVGAAIQNALLAACSLGLGACWLGEIVNRKDEVADWLGLPKNLEIMAVMVVGYPAGQEEKGERKPLRELMIERAGCGSS